MSQIVDRFRLRHTVSTIEVLHKNQRVASHIRSVRRGQHTTDPAHMPESHRRHAEWSPSRILAWAGKIGPETAQLATAILTDRRHPEQGFRSCLGILRLGKKYTPERLERACARAHAAGARSYTSVNSILERGMDNLPPLVAPAAATPSFDHENVRGPSYYQ